MTILGCHSERSEESYRRTVILNEVKNLSGDRSRSFAKAAQDDYVRFVILNEVKNLTGGLPF